jgi:mannose-6-phosphate isomerase-like protein (cupin superfamily)
MTLPAIDRVVTGHDQQGKAVVLTRGALPTVVELAAIPGTVFHEVWNTEAVPATIAANEQDPTVSALKLPPPRGGARIRYVDIPPDTEEFLARGHERMQQAFTEIGDRDASTVKSSSPHPVMHRTESVDYGIVIDGEITLVLDDSEVSLKPGGVVIQRGTNHAWANRSGKLCRMLFILIDGRYEPSLAAALTAR